MARTLAESVARIRKFRERDARTRVLFPGFENATHRPLTVDQMIDRGYTHARVTSFGYAIGVMPSLYGGGFVCCGVDWDGGHDVEYQYDRFDDAVRAMSNIDESLLSEPCCREPSGWVCCSDGRRRPNGDPLLEKTDDSESRLNQSDPSRVE
jgi:hypothetical protein